MKPVYLSVVFFFFTIVISAQTSFGIKAGLNVANVDINLKDSSPDGKLGGYVGTLVDFRLFKNLHLQPEVQYSREGIEDGSVDFMNIPVSLKWFFVEGIHVNAGPQFGIVLDAEGGTNGLNKSQFAGIFGLGYETPGGFMIDTRFAMGVTSIIDRDYAIDSGLGYNIVGVQGWTRTFSFGVGYKF